MKPDIDLVYEMINRQITRLMEDLPNCVIVFGYKDGDEIKGIMSYKKSMRDDAVAIVSSLLEKDKYPQK